MAKMRASETTAVNWRDHVGQLGDGVHGTSTQFAMEHGSPSAMEHCSPSALDHYSPSVMDHARLSPMFTPTHRVLRARHDTNNTSLPSPAPSCGGRRHLSQSQYVDCTEMSTPMTGVSMSDAELLLMVKAELDEAQQSNRRPPPAYVCHCCYGQGHYIKDCPKVRYTRD
jgi:hypothetical protein